jgi:hypothetical protein
VNDAQSKGDTGRLNTPLKRIGGLCLMVGVATFVLGIWQFSNTSSTLANAKYAFDRGFFWALRSVGEDSNGTGAFLLWIGLFLSGAGLLTSYFYDHTLGKVRHWVMTGTTRRSTLAKSQTPVQKQPVAVPRPRKPRSRLTMAVLEVLGLLFANWLTMLMTFCVGVVFCGADHNPWLLLAPAGIAMLMVFRAVVSGGIDSGPLPLKHAPTLFAVKVLLGYVSFAVGYVSAATGLIR